MRKAFAVTVFLFFLTPGLATAQTTWNGLRFGMSIKEAQDAMGTKKIKMVPGDPQMLKSAIDYDIQFPGTAYPFPLIVELHFDSAGLSMVDLQLDVQEYRRRKPGLSSDNEAAWLFGSVSYNALVEKYGNPMRQEDDCQPMPSSPSWNTGCSAEWRADGQSIGFVVTPSSSTGVLIEYKPQPTQL
jgi:hypothetical protein